ncbi:MAG: hypothetical protein QM757_34605 [Paludibaculum sp.]
MSDGAGALTGGDTYRTTTGTTYRQTLTGTYTINEDCSGTITFTGSASGTSHFDIIVTSSGQAAEIVQTDSGMTLGGTMRLQQTAASTSTTTPTTPTDPAAQNKK